VLARPSAGPEPCRDIRVRAKLLSLELEETIKEFATIDGAFIVRATVSCSRQEFNCKRSRVSYSTFPPGSARATRPPRHHGLDGRRRVRDSQSTRTVTVFKSDVSSPDPASEGIARARASTTDSKSVSLAEIGDIVGWNTCWIVRENDGWPVLPPDWGSLATGRNEPSFATYALGLMGDGERKSMEPMAARACPTRRCQRRHERLTYSLGSGCRRRAPRAARYAWRR